MICDTTERRRGTVLFTKIYIIHTNLLPKSSKHAIVTEYNKLIDF